MIRLIPLLAAFAVLLWQPTESVAFSTLEKEVWRAWEEGDCSTYRKGRKRLADQNHILSQRSIATGYLYGKKCFSQDFRLARIWLQKALEAGGDNTVLVPKHYGIMYYHGFGVAVDHDEALRWFKQAQALLDKHLRIQQETANRDKGNPANIPLITPLMLLADIAGGITINEWILQIKLLRSWGPNNPTHQQYIQATKEIFKDRWSSFRRENFESYEKTQAWAASLYRISLEQSVYQSKSTLNYEKHIEPNLYSYFLPDAERGSQLHQYYIGKLYYLGFGVPKDYKLSVKWHRKASDHGYKPAQDALEIMRNSLIRSQLEFLVSECLYDQVHKIKGAHSRQIVAEHCRRKHEKKLEKKSLDWLLRNSD